MLIADCHALLVSKNMTRLCWSR